MPCFRPLKGYKGIEKTKNGKNPVVFNVNDGYSDSKIQVPCGRCIGCRLDKSKQWALRIMHEASLYESNCFITLTYDEKNCPRSLNVEDFQLFMKRLRNVFLPKKIRFYHAAEYGTRTNRPHHHACLFNCDFYDKKIACDRQDKPIYNSESLTKIWGKGHTSISDLNFNTARYVAKYVTKKITGDMAESHYNGRKPEFSTMSRKPGIGTAWIKQYLDDVYPNDYVVANKGVKYSPPKFYDKYLDNLDQDMLKEIKLDRKLKNRNNPNNDSTRLVTAEYIQNQKLNTLQRTL